MGKIPGLPYLNDRLSITHGSANIPQKKKDETIPGVSEASITSRQTSQAETPEAYASRRGMIINTGLLFSAYDDLSIQPAASEKETASTNESAINIQVGAFSRRENADHHLTFLKSRGISARLLEEERTDGRIVYKTIVPVSDKENAQTELIRLKELGIEGFILY